MGRKRFAQKIDDGGFTLVELMVTVAVVGLLSSIAVPNYQAFVARSHQTEAKVQLADVYTAETSYQIESQTFTTCLYGTGFNHTFTGNYYYAIGFASGSVTCGMNGTTDCHLVFSGESSPPVFCKAGAFPAGGFWPGVIGVKGPPVSIGVFTANVTTSISTDHFTVAAAGNISSMGATVPDIWTINELKTLFNNRSGI